MKQIYVREDIDFVDINTHGAWVIYGVLGVRQFYGYSKREAIRQYKQDIARSGPVVCRSKGDANARNRQQRK